MTKEPKTLKDLIDAFLARLDAKKRGGIVKRNYPCPEPDGGKQVKR